VKRITAEAAQIGAQDLSRRLEVTGKDELSELASTFNGMIARLEAAFQQMEQAYEQQRRFTADASHELRTPLTTIKANTSLALCGEPTPAEYREALEAADEAADSMNRIVQDLLLLARSDGGQLGLALQAVPLRELLGRAISVVQDPESAELALRLQAEDLAVVGDSHHLARLFVNLLENAIRHTPATGKITVQAEPDPRAPARVAIRVTDTGEGIPAQHLPHVCERFYRVDAARSHGSRGGTGLGLAICQSIVQAHSGTLQISSEIGRGTTVTVTLPRAEVSAPELPALTGAR
jgi:signal transduction histidine kinase